MTFAEKISSERSSSEKGIVVGFHTDSFYETLQIYLEKKVINNKNNTAVNYKGHIQDFFTHLTGKNNMAMITWDDVLSITQNQVESYIIFLKRDRGLRFNTIDTKMAAIKKFYEKMAGVNKNIDISVVNVETFDDEEDTNNKWGALYEEEVRALIAFCDNEKFKPLIKKLFFATSWTTAIRKECLLSLTWENIILEKDPKTKIDVWTIQGIDKGNKKFIQPIRNSLYNYLCKLKEIKHPKGYYLNNPTDKLFPISDESLNDTLKRFCLEYGINQKERNIVLHSLRKASTDKVYNSTGDIKKTQAHGNWSTVDVPMNTYVGTNKDLINAPSLTVFEDFEDTDSIEKSTNLEQYSKEELIRAITDCNTYLQNEIIKKLKKEQ